MIRSVALWLFVCLMLAPAAQADRVVAALSQNQVSITAGFTGQEILVYGAITPRPDDEPGDLDVVVSIVGPYEAVTVRRKQRIAGIWINAEAQRLAAVPSFHAVASSDTLAAVLSLEEDVRWRVSIEHALGREDDDPVPRNFLDAAMRLRREAGLYRVDRDAVRIDEGVLFQTRIPLPSEIEEGTYTAQVLLIRDRMVIDSFGRTIEVRKAGLGRLISQAASRQPILYGVLSIVVALSAGLLASEVFRYLRR